MLSLDEVRKALPKRLARWAAEFVSAAQVARVDPLLLAAICDRESLGGEALKPKGPTGSGDFEYNHDPVTGKPTTIKSFPGHGRGLMQIDDRAHKSFTSVDADWTDPLKNITYAADRVLRPALLRFQGSVPCALAAYNAGEMRVRRALQVWAEMPPDADLTATLDKLTTGHNYVSDVLRRYHEYVLLAGGGK